MPLVTLEEAKQHLYVTDTAQDALIERDIASAEKQIRHYLNQEIPTNDDSPATYPADIVSAALLIIGGLFEVRQSMNADGSEYKENPAVKNLLYPYRVDIGI